MATEKTSTEKQALARLVNQQHQAVTRARQSLAHQRSELQRLRVAFQEAWLDVTGGVEDLAKLRTDNSSLRKLLAERDQAHGVSVKLAKEQEETLMAELATLRQKLAEKDAKIEE